jgi:hypothetical protein
MTSFTEILPRLAATYEAGRLVPFLGSGMSVPACTDWSSFVHGLECEASGQEAISAGGIRKPPGAARRAPGGMPRDRQRTHRRAGAAELPRCRFFVEVVSDSSDMERRLFQEMPETKLGKILRTLHFRRA